MRDLDVLVVDLSAVAKRLQMEVHGVVGNDLLRKLKAVVDVGRGELRLRQ